MIGKGAAVEATRLVCRGCGWRPAPGDLALRCGGATPEDGIDHVIVRVIDPAARVEFPAGAEPNPFVRYRTLFHAYHVARRLGCSDADYVATVERLDRAVGRVDGHGFRASPFRRADGLSERLGFSNRGGVYVKDETRNVSGSHKARHLAGTLLELEVADAACGDASPASGAPPLAIASCGNAALAAAVVARAAGRRLRVFIPVDADAAVVARLKELGAELETCERKAGVTGDPTYHRLLEALAAGAEPFTCQGNLNGLAIEGGETLGWEIVSSLVESGERLDRIGRLDRIFVQVGGGALASAVVAAFDDARRLGAPVELPQVHAVQTRGAFPLARAYRLLADRLLDRPRTDPRDTDAILAAPPAAELDHLAALVGSPAGRDALDYAARHRAEFMWPWEAEPRSIAHGILDDETYDWLAVVEGMLASGGHPVVVDEATLEEANHLGREATGIDVDHTGSAGLAGLVRLIEQGAVAPDERVAVLFTGIRRNADRAAAGARAAAAAPSSRTTLTTTARPD